MKKLYMALALLGILLMLNLGAVLAIQSGNNGETAESSIQVEQPVAITAVGKNSMTFFDAATNGYLIDTSSGATLSKAITNAFMEVPANSIGEFGTPLELPAKINGKSTAVRYLYLQWLGDSGNNITRVTVFSGSYEIKSMPTSYIGTGSLQNITVDLGAYYHVPSGLGIGWEISNSDPTFSHFSEFYAYGAKVRY